MPGLSNNLGVRGEPYCLSGKSKRGTPKVYQSELLQGTGGFKGQIPVPLCIIYQDKVTTQQDSAASLDEMVQIVTNTFYNRTGEGGQGPGKGEKERDKACPDTGCPPGKPYGTPLEGQGMRQMPNL